MLHITFSTCFALCVAAQRFFFFPLLPPWIVFRCVAEILALLKCDTSKIIKCGKIRENIDMSRFINVASSTAAKPPVYFRHFASFFSREKNLRKRDALQ